jgi:poly(A) polymerase Pap1
MIARMEVKEPIEGVCDQQNVLVLMSFFGAYQVEAKSPMTKAQITQELQEKVDFLKNNSEYNDKGMVNLIINCKGDLVQCKIDNKTKNPELDNQIVAVFSGLKKWTPGTYSGKPVDSVLLYSFVIENGKIKLN